MSDVKWQPAVIITDTGRVECIDCQALAIFILFKQETRDNEDGAVFTPYCQSCFEKYQEREETE